MLGFFSKYGGGGIMAAGKKMITEGVGKKLKKGKGKKEKKIT